MGHQTHRTNDEQLPRRTIEKLVHGPNGEFSPYRAAVATILILLTVLGTVGWFWITTVSAEQRLIDARLNELGTRHQVLETKYDSDVRYIREAIEEIRAEMKHDRRTRTE